MGVLLLVASTTSAHAEPRVPETREDVVVRIPAIEFEIHVPAELGVPCDLMAADATTRVECADVPVIEHRETLESIRAGATGQLVTAAYGFPHEDGTTVVWVATGPDGPIWSREAIGETERDMSGAVADARDSGTVFERARTGRILAESLSNGVPTLRSRLRNECAADDPECVPLLTVSTIYSGSRSNVMVYVVGCPENGGLLARTLARMDATVRLPAANANVLFGHPRARALGFRIGQFGGGLCVCGLPILGIGVAVRRARRSRRTP